MPKRTENTFAVALITGSAMRLGREFALGLAKNGFNICIHYYTSKTEALELASEIETSFHKSVLLVKADISKVSQIEAMMKQVVKKFGRIDLLVNNASVFIKSGLEETTEEIWDKSLNTNLKGAFFCSKIAAKHMLKKGGGNIINIASLGGIKPFANYVPYSVSKAGLIMLTKCLAKSLAPYILVNAIAPGTIEFENEKVNKNEKILLKEYTKASELADLVVFLATKNKHITGQIISIDSGNSLI
ncbi:MAG: SDR family NAD(P)-dependent oxidoreductase [Bacteroidota bacterium]|nr:SDR family NAD(P)-dependent oxidoreductase [Bacteroidota bacterium]